MSIHQKALDSIFGDMDEFEKKRMFPEPAEDGESGKGMSITITMTPDESHKEAEKDEGINPGDMENLPANHDADECMSMGGCAYHKGGMAMAKGGMVPEATPSMGETDDLTLPPFLRKKKNPTGK